MTCLLHSRFAHLFVPLLLLAGSGMGRGQDLPPIDAKKGDDLLTVPAASGLDSTSGQIGAAREAVPENPGKAKTSGNYQAAENKVREHADFFFQKGAKVKDLDRTALRDEVKRAFEARQDLLREEVAEFRSRLDRLARLSGEREKNKDAIIDRRVEDLLNPDLRWEAASEPPREPGRGQSNRPYGRPGVKPVGPTASTKKPANPAADDNEKAAPRIFFLLFAKAERLAKTLQELSSEESFSARIATEAATNSLIVFAKPRDLKIIEGIIRALDQEPSAGVVGSLAKPDKTSAGSPESGQDPTKRLRKGISLLDQIQGTWLATRQGSNGELRPFKQSVFTLTFRDNKYEFREGAADAYSSGTFTVDPVFGKHNALDLAQTYLRGVGPPVLPQQPHVEHTIMQIEGDSLTMCSGGHRANDRPDEFTTAKDDGRLLMIYRRISARPLTTDELKALDFTRFQEVSLPPAAEKANEGKPVIEKNKPLAPVEEVLPENKSAAANLHKLLGLELRIVKADSVAREPFKGGLQVVSIVENGPAAKAGLRVDDIVVGAQVWEVLSIEHLQYALDHGSALRIPSSPTFTTLNLHIVRSRNEARELFRASLPLPLPSSEPSGAKANEKESPPLTPGLPPNTSKPEAKSGIDGPTSWEPSVDPERSK